MNRAYFSGSFESFLVREDAAILGDLLQGHELDQLEIDQRIAWQEEIAILKSTLTGRSGHIYLEYSIPRMGRRIDAVLIVEGVVFVLEFKVGENHYTPYAIDQVVDYALDLKNFHEASHSVHIAPILIATQAIKVSISAKDTGHGDKLLAPILTNATKLGDAIDVVMQAVTSNPIQPAQWEAGRYKPTPTIIEAAMALYNGHSVTHPKLYQRSFDCPGPTHKKAFAFLLAFPVLEKRWWVSMWQQNIRTKLAISTASSFQETVHLSPFYEKHLLETR